MSSPYVHSVNGGYTGVEYPVDNFVADSGRTSRGIQYARKIKGTFLGLAISQLILGLIVLAIGVAALVLCVNVGAPCNEDWTMISGNLWGGSAAIQFSVFGIIQSCKTTKCTIGANFVTSIIGTIIIAAGLGLEIASTVFSSGTILILHAVACVLDFILLTLFIASSSYAGKAHECCVGCCFDTGQLQMSPPPIPTTTHHPQILTLQNGQTIIVQGPSQHTSYPNPTSLQYTTATLNGGLPGVINGSTQPNGPGFGVANHGFVASGLKNA